MRHELLGNRATVIVVDSSWTMFDRQGSTVTPLALLFLDSTVGCKSILLLLAK
jgi:hypothetical protein